MDHLSSLLTKLAPSLGLDSLGVNENNVLSLEFENEIAVHIEPDPRTGKAQMYSVLCRQPEDAEGRMRMFEALLSANCFGRGTGGAAFGLDERSGDILLGSTFDPERTDPDRLLAAIATIVKAMSAWRGRMHDLIGARPEREPENGDLPPSNGPTHFIRA